MAKKITKIPATLNRFTSESVVVSRKKKVAGYARVSTDREEQASSYEAQMSYYQSYIKGHDEWEFVGMYSDEGITATNTKNREGFKQMVDDAYAGKIDLIITKSVSRFARNTVDSLTTIRGLKEKGVEVYFEKENIWTFDSKGELLITIMSSLAQEESRSISENTTWGRRKQFADGKGSLAYSHFLGYDKDFKINKEQAAVVRLIYKLFIDGYSLYAICRELEKRKIESPCGLDIWHINTVKSILTNEKYRGDALLQKQYTVDFLQKTKKDNHGEVPQYYVEEHHKAIIPPDQFDFVQAELARREKRGRYSGVSIYTTRIKCGYCGGWYGPRVLHSNKKYRKVIYCCNQKYSKNNPHHHTPNFSLDDIQQMFLQALNSLLDEKKETRENLTKLMKKVCRTTALEKELEGLEQELCIVSENLENFVRKHATTDAEQSEKEEHLQKLCNDKKNRIAELKSCIKEKHNRKYSIQNFIDTLDGLNGKQTEFSEELWGSLLDHILIDENRRTVVFRGDIEVTVWTK